MTIVAWIGLGIVLGAVLAVLFSRIHPTTSAALMADPPPPPPRLVVPAPISTLNGTFYAGLAEALTAADGPALARLIEDARWLAGLTSARGEPVRLAFDIGVVLREAAGEDTALEIAPDLPRSAGGDAARLRELLACLTAHARLRRRGTVRMSAVRLDRGPGSVRLAVAVSDDGPPLPQAARADPFAPFAGGQLALARARALAESLNATLVAETPPQGGCTIRLEVDLAARRASDGADPPQTAAGRRVLVVEDDPGNRLVFARMLERLGHRAEAVGDGEAALLALAAGHYDAAVLDIRLPGQDGMSIARAVRALPGAEGRLALVAVTADAVGTNAELCRAAGFDAYALKPVTAGRLAMLLEEAWRAHPPDAPDTPMALPPATAGRRAED